MSLSSKNSRKITVANRDFKWTISPHSTYVILVIEAANVKGQRIEVSVETDIGRWWVEFPYVEGLNERVIMPKNVADVITQALKMGWSPDAKGAPLKFELVEEKLQEVVRRTR